ncbi:hypothetical protein [Fundicoccus culcitae]|uniref:Uncharacterized protein n=1 Tax=Fundicoccus culcitae TaxID=2969821 RepID=A0ABY5P8I2_9LACT|nr:hypothetical protein [Fundicoccus culcitae]UUX35063.1 hypothetical protein NRE15_05320 [Fundicoccus culcitae]
MLKKLRVLGLLVMFLVLNTVAIKQAQGFFKDDNLQSETVRLETGYLDLATISNSQLDLSVEKNEQSIVIRNNGTLAGAVYFKVTAQAITNSQFYSKLTLNQQAVSQLNQMNLLETNGHPVIVEPGEQLSLTIKADYPMDIRIDEVYHLTVGLIQTNLIDQIESSQQVTYGFNDSQTMDVKLVANSDSSTPAGWPTEAEFAQAEQLESNKLFYVFNYLLFGSNQAHGGSGKLSTIEPGKIFIKLPENATITYSDKQLVNHVIKSFSAHYSVEVTYYKNLGFEVDIYLKNNLNGLDSEAMLIQTTDILLASGRYDATTHIPWMQIADFARPLILNTDISHSGPDYVSLASNRTITTSQVDSVHQLYYLAKRNWNTYATAVTQDLSTYLSVEVSGPFTASLTNNQLAIRQTTNVANQTGNVILRSKLTGQIVLTRPLVSIRTSNFAIPTEMFTPLDANTSVYTTPVKVEASQTVATNRVETMRVAQEQTIEVYIKFEEALSPLTEFTFEQLPKGYQLIDAVRHENNHYIKATFAVSFEEVVVEASTPQTQRVATSASLQTVAQPSMSLKLTHSLTNASQWLTVYFAVEEQLEVIEESIMSSDVESESSESDSEHLESASIPVESVADPNIESVDSQLPTESVSENADVIADETPSEVGVEAESPEVEKE